MVKCCVLIIWKSIDKINSKLSNRVMTKSMVNIKVKYMYGEE